MEDGAQEMSLGVHAWDAACAAPAWSMPLLEASSIMLQHRRTQTTNSGDTRARVAGSNALCCGHMRSNSVAVSSCAGVTLV